MRKLSPEKMLEKIKSGYYYIVLSDGLYFLTHDYGTKHSEVVITKERANEWLSLGAELLEL